MKGFCLLVRSRMKGPQPFDGDSNHSRSIVRKERNVARSASQLWKLVLVGSNPAAPISSLFLFIISILTISYLVFFEI